MKTLIPLFFVFLSTSQTILAQCTATIIASGPTTFCAGDSLELTANSPSLKKADFSGVSRGLAAAFTIGTKAYVGTGYHSNYKSDFWEYDPSTNTWTQKADFGGVPRGYATGLAIGSKGYIGTGSNGTTLKDFWEYNPSTNAWTRKADFGGTARINACGFTVGSKGYLGTGLDLNSNYTKDFWEYNPATNVWARKADFGGTGRYAAVSFGIGTKGYLGTGVSFTTVNTKDFWEYNPATNTWAQKADFGGTERFGAVGFALGSNGFIGTGYTTTFMRDFWKYSPSGNTWTRSPDFGGSAREFSIAFSTGSKAYVGTGIDNKGFTSDIWEYDASNTFLWSTGATSSQITVTTSGTYTVTVTSSTLGCSATSSPVTVTVNQPSFSDTTAIACNTFTWHDITYKMSGDYYYIIRNTVGCDSTITLHLTINSIHSTYKTTDATCYGLSDGSIIITPTDGVYPYTYKLGTVRPFVSDSTFTGLRAGKYRITINDATGCAGLSDQITINQLPAITYSYGSTAALCYASPTGSFYVNATSGVAPFEYKLGTTGTYNTFNSFANLRGGNYRVTIRDAKGCIKNTNNITVAQPPQVRATFTKTNETCPNKKDGTITMIDSIGFMPLAYRFGTAGTYSSTRVFTSLKAGDYRIYVKDANNCVGLPVVVPIVQICGSAPLLEPSMTETKIETDKLIVYPNPSAGRFTLQLNHTKTGKADIIVCNESGMIVQQKQVNLQSFQNSFNIDMQSNAPGVYIVKVRTEQGVQITKVFIAPK